MNKFNQSDYWSECFINLIEELKKFWSLAHFGQNFINMCYILWETVYDISHLGMYKIIKYPKNPRVNE